MSLRLVGCVAYDIGAYIGEYSMYLAKAVGANGTVVSFEPARRNLRELRLNLEQNFVANVRVLPVAVGRHSGQQVLHVNRLLPARSSLCVRSDESRSSAAETVSVRPLDKVVVEQCLPVPDFVKIDVEGAESDVLAGMCNLVKKHKPALLVELHGSGLSADVVELLRSLQYGAYHVEHKKVVDLHRDSVPPRGHIYCLHARDDNWRGAS